MGHTFQILPDPHMGHNFQILPDPHMGHNFQGELPCSKAGIEAADLSRNSQQSDTKQGEGGFTRSSIAHMHWPGTVHHGIHIHIKMVF